MTSLDLRVGALSLLGNPGTNRTLRLIFTADGDLVTPGPVSVWIGGDERHPNDFTDATEHPAAVAGNEATVTVPIPAGRELLRVTIDGVLATIGTVAPSLRGTVDQDQTVQVNLDTLEVRLDLAAVPIDLEQRLAGKQDADQALTDLSGATVEAWGKSWLAIANAGAARAELGLGTAATMSPAEIAADPALSATYAPLRPTELVFSPAEMSFVRDGATFGTYPSGSATLALTSWALPHDQTLPAVSITARLPHGWSRFRVELWWANATTSTGQVNFDIRARGYAEGGNLGAVGLVGGGTEPWEGTVTAGAQNELQHLALSTVFAAGMAPGRIFAVRIARRPSVEVGGLAASAHVLAVRLTPVEPA